MDMDTRVVVCTFSSDFDVYAYVDYLYIPLFIYMTGDPKDGQWVASIRSLDIPPLLFSCIIQKRTLARKIKDNLHLTVRI
jgi:hypothetical protein